MIAGYCSLVAGAGLCVVTVTAVSRWAKESSFGDAHEQRIPPNMSRAAIVGSAGFIEDWPPPG